jgi:3',5'-cyclic AMP phosphodiesterase CpdA
VVHAGTPAFLASLALALGGFSCAFINESDNVSASKRGDTSMPAERRSPIAELRVGCGDGDVTATGRVIARHPYLQQVTKTSAMIGWTTTSPKDQRVDVTLPDGSPVASVAAIVEPNYRRSDTKQVWATVTGLVPGTVYCYSIANGTRLTERTGFRTAPSSTDAPVRFLAFGDSGVGGGDQRTLRNRMLDFPFDLIVHTGDVAYSDGSLAQYERNVFGIYGQMFRNVPFFPAAGNHDYKTMDGEPFRYVFALPGDNHEKWYSYDWGSVHFVALDTESDYATQARWLAKDLAATTLPWKIVYLHRPPYSSGAHGSDVQLRRVLAPILETHGVQLVLAGHDHDYERMKPQGGVNYVVTGGGGRGTYDVGRSSFTAFSEEVIHFVYVEVGGDELVLHAIDATGTEFDSLSITI